LRYAIRSREGTARITNISRRGVLFAADTPLPVGERIAVSLKWPAQRVPDKAIRLRLWGRVVRSDNSGTAMTIERYRFQSGADSDLSGARP